MLNIIYKIKKEEMNDIHLSVNININSCIKEFSVFFQYAPALFLLYNDGSTRINFSYYMNLIPLYVYKKNLEGKYDLELINNTNINNTINTDIYVTPFEISGIYPIFYLENNIQFLLDEKSEFNTFYELDKEGNLEILKSNISKWELKQEKFTEGWWLFGKKTYIYFVSESLPLIGEYKGIWYPAINYFMLPDKDIMMGFYSYDKIKDENPKNFVKMRSKIIIQKFGFEAVGNLICQDNVFKNIEKILEKLPDEIGKEIFKSIDLKPISEEVKKKAGKDGLDNLYKKEPDLFEGTIFKMLKENNNDKITILKNNIVTALFLIFKTRYEELKKNGLRDFILLNKDDKERFNKKVEEMRDKYFCKNKDPEIPDKFDIKDELSKTNQYIKILEKDKIKYLKKYDKQYFPKIKLSHYNNNYLYDKFSSDELNKTDSSIIIPEENKKASSSKLLSSDINLPELIRPEIDLTLNKLIDFYNRSIEKKRRK